MKEIKMVALMVFGLAADLVETKGAELVVWMVVLTVFEMVASMADALGNETVVKTARLMEKQMVCEKVALLVALLAFE